jgi:hypothetical protein
MATTLVPVWGEAVIRLRIGFQKGYERAFYVNPLRIRCRGIAAQRSTNVRRCLGGITWRTAEPPAAGRLRAGRYFLVVTFLVTVSPVAFLAACRRSRRACRELAVRAASSTARAGGLPSSSTRCPVAGSRW